VLLTGLPHALNRLVPAADYWTEAEHSEFIAWIALHPEAGDVIPASGSCRKVRWSRSGKGKRGGVRVIYYNRLTEGMLWLLLIYGKGAVENIPAHTLRALRNEIDHG
jgi:hypothetical protein